MGAKKILGKVGKVVGKGAVHRVLGPDAATTLFGGGVAATGGVAVLATVLANPEMWDSLNMVLANINSILVQLALILAGLGLIKSKVGKAVGDGSDKDPES